MFKKKPTFWLILLSLLFLICDYFGMFTFIKEPFESLIVPLKRDIYQINLKAKSITSVISQYSQLIKVFEEREKLKKQNEEMNLELQFLKSENKKLRIQLEAPMPASYQYVPAKVLGVNRFMEVGGGEKEGIKKGMIVVDGNVLIGKVITVSPRRSLVMLLNDLEMKIPARTSRGTKGDIVGGTGENIILDKVLQKDPLFLEDAVFTSGEQDYPPNLIIGKIAYITVLDVAVYKQAKVAPAVDYQREETVFVITSQ